MSANPGAGGSVAGVIIRKADLLERIRQLSDAQRLLALIRANEALPAAAMEAVLDDIDAVGSPEAVAAVELERGRSIRRAVNDLHAPIGAYPYSPAAAVVDNAPAPVIPLGVLKRECENPTPHEPHSFHSAENYPGPYQCSGAAGRRRCPSCGRLEGMPSAPCLDCPESAEADPTNDD